LKYALPDDNTSEKLNLPNPLLLDKYKLNQVFEVENIYYDLNKWDIREDAKPSLDELVRLLKQNPISVELGSHTDCRASTAYNNTLSQKRAESAVKYLVSKGISPDRLTAKGYGETKLKNKCADGVPCSEAEHQANRRTEFKVTSIIVDKIDDLAFDPDSFKAGEKIGLNELPEGFFNDCK
jgi:outer membrane protein OmpA-like peptidoglycan-associated protein